MPATESFTLSKEERMSSKLLINELFGGTESRSLVAFPLRLVYMKHDRDNEKQFAASILISVHKRHFKHAVDRNKVKRQIREAYRLHKSLLNYSEDQCVAMAFIWLDNKHHSSRRVEHCVTTLLKRMKERL